MKKTRFTDEQIVGVPKAGEAGEGIRAMQKAWHQRGDLLQLESEVRRHGAVVVG